tara:strand:+ start:343 stop:918 length:576 start_codon:yes stop_codon:yes gene_type:complete
MADRVIFKGTKKLERYVAELSKGMKNGLEDACKELSVKAVMKAREQIGKKQMNMSGQLSESLIPIPGPYVDKKKGTATIGITQQGGMAVYGVAQERGGKPKFPSRKGMERLTTWVNQKFGFSLAPGKRGGMSQARRVAGAVGLKLKKDGIEKKGFAEQGFRDLFPTVKGKIFTEMKQANRNAASKANRDNR